MNASFTCPDCDGSGLLGSFICNSKKKLQCSLCFGSGKISALQQEWIHDGKLMSQKRKSKDLSLMEIAKLIGKNVGILSDMEHGKCEPDLSLYSKL